MLSNLLEPGQVLAGAPTATPTVVWAPEVPPGPQWLMDFVIILYSQKRSHTHDLIIVGIDFGLIVIVVWIFLLLHCCGLLIF